MRPHYKKPIPVRIPEELEEEGESPEVASALIDQERAEVTIALIELSAAWDIAPELVAQVIADSITPGQTFGETLYLNLLGME